MNALVVFLSFLLFLALIGCAHVKEETGPPVKHASTAKLEEKIDDLKSQLAQSRRENRELRAAKNTASVPAPISDAVVVQEPTPQPEEEAPRLSQ
jgi:hypothetical protein